MNTSSIRVFKRDGRLQSFDLDKIHRILEWATKDVSGVSISEIELRANIQLYDKIPAYDIHELLIKSAAELVSENTPNYSLVAGRLVSYRLRKDVYNQYEPLPLYDIIQNNIQSKVYTNELIQYYTKEEIDSCDEMIKHERDEDFHYSGMEQWRGKYLVQDRSKKIFFETPQIAYMCIAMILFMNEEPIVRLDYVKKFYDLISTHVISLPTPILAGVRTPTKQFSSCVLIDCGDSLDSIVESSSAIVKYVAKRAGIGLNVGRIRAEGSKVGSGEILHTGVIPYIKYFQSSVKSSSQGGVRGGAATLFFPIWHYEFPELLVLKNNKGTEETRARHVDYAVQLSKLFYERLISNSNITFFSPNDVPELYESFFTNPEKFKTLYEEAEKNDSIRKRTLPAVEVFSNILSERKDTGRIYIMNVDHCNTHSSFDEKLAPIYMSNLCLEVTLNTQPLNYKDKNEGEIALCTLSAINWGKIKNPDDFEEPCKLIVRALDNLLSYQDYILRTAELGAKTRRTLGIGITNFAYFLAKRGLKYDAQAFETVDEYAEAWAYYLTKASIDLAEERGPCPAVHQTKYSTGILPIDTANLNALCLTSREYSYNWEELRHRLKVVGIRNSTLMALMPVESSSQISNSTNGIEPPVALVTYKTSKHGVLPQVVPEISKLKNKYHLRWDQTSPEDYLKILAILQVYIDQAISVNTSYDPIHFENNEIPMTQLFSDLILAYKLGHKTLYYFNTNDHADDSNDAHNSDLEIKEEEYSKQVDQDDCESCKL